MRAGRREEEGGEDVAGTRVEGPGGKALMNRGLEEPSIRVTAVQQLNQATSSRSPLLDLKLWAEGTRES